MGPFVFIVATLPRSSSSTCARSSPGVEESGLISQKVFVRNSPFQHKCVNFFFILVTITDPATLQLQNLRAIQVSGHLNGTSRPSPTHTLSLSLTHTQLRVLGVMVSARDHAGLAR